MKIRLTFDVIGNGILAITAFLVGVIILIGTMAGVRVSVDLPKAGLISPLQPIIFTFSEPVDFKKAAAIIRIDPAHQGYIVQIDERSLEFIPYQPYQLGIVYKLSIGSDIIAKDGHATKKVHQWEFMVREPLVAFLSPNARDSSIWAIDLKGNPPQRLTREGISVIAFDAAPSGDFLIYTVIDFRCV